jgi:uncharacterized protein (UPF0335 family)
MTPIRTTQGHSDVSTGFRTTDPSPDIDPNVVTDERAEMLAQHCIYVQGGFSTAEIERKRAEADLAKSPGCVGWDRMQAEVSEAMLARIKAMTPATPEPAPEAAPAEAVPAEPEAAPEPAVDPTPPTTKRGDRVDVTAVLASVDQGEALRDRIKKLTAELKVHEDNIKDVLGEATVGVDASGHVVVRYTHHNRSGLSKEKVKSKLSAADYTECETVTSYRRLLYGEG